MKNYCQPNKKDIVTFAEDRSSKYDSVRRLMGDFSLGIIKLWMIYLQQMRGEKVSKEMLVICLYYQMTKK